MRNIVEENILLFKKIVLIFMIIFSTTTVCACNNIVGDTEINVYMNEKNISVTAYTKISPENTENSGEKICENGAKSLEKYLDETANIKPRIVNKFFEDDSVPKCKYSLTIPTSKLKDTKIGGIIFENTCSVEINTAPNMRIEGKHYWAKTFKKGTKFPNNLRIEKTETLNPVDATETVEHTKEVSELKQDSFTKTLKHVAAPFIILILAPIIISIIIIIFIIHKIKQSRKILNNTTKTRIEDLWTAPDSPTNIKHVLRKELPQQYRRKEKENI